MVEPILELLGKMQSMYPATNGILTVTMGWDSYNALCDELGYEVKEINGCKILVEPSAPEKCIYFGRGE